MYNLKASFKMPSEVIFLLFQILLTIALMFFVVRKARVELKKTVETEEEVPLVDVTVNENNQSFTEKSAMNGYTGNNRTRVKSGS